ncbi:alpha/beta fold hydrolase [Aestuariivirga sp.]|uniref:alpha/beta fold hydrolase n=1 Tax=Aestuariivirga sp. TaxID=2650926 RepID=UPI003BA9D0B1
MSGIAFKTGGGEGPDLVLIHGFGSDRLSWIGNTPALMQVARVHALDLPGHGDSLDVDCGDASPAALAVQVSRVLAENSIARAHLVGHSLGGGIAMLMAAKHPERVASLTLIAAAGLGTGIDHAFLTRFPGLSEIDETTGLLHRLVVRPQLINRLTVQRVIEQLARPGARDALSRIAAGIIATEAQLSETAQQIALLDVPRLVVFGTEDRINPPDLAAINRFGGTSLLIPSAGHLPHIEAAAQVNRAVATLLSGTAH